MAAVEVPLGERPEPAASGPRCGPVSLQPRPSEKDAGPVSLQPRPSEKDAELAQKLGQLQPFIAVFPQECMGQLASFGPT